MKYCPSQNRIVGHDVYRSLENTAGSGSSFQLFKSFDSANRIVNGCPTTSGGPPTSIAMMYRPSPAHTELLNNDHPGSSIAVRLSQSFRSPDLKQVIRLPPHFSTPNT